MTSSQAKMTRLERTIGRVRRRLFLNRWLRFLVVAVGVAGVVFGVAVLLNRMFDVPMRLLYAGAALLGAGLVASIAAAWITLESSGDAAALLDRAASLDERLSSACCCIGWSDSYAQAVVADAEAVSASLVPRRYLPIQAPRSLWWASGCVLLSGLTLLVPRGLLGSDREAREERLAAEQSRAAVERHLEDVRRVLESTPALEDLRHELDREDSLPGPKLDRAADVRHEALKQIESLADAARKRAEDERYRAAQDARKLFRGLGAHPLPGTLSKELADALRRGDFAAAQEETARLREHLALLRSSGDRDLRVELGAELAALADRLEELADSGSLLDELTQTGLSREEAERLMDEQERSGTGAVRDELRRHGLSERQVERLAERIRERVQGGRISRKLADGLRRAAQSAGDTEDAESAASLAAAADQLAELRELEQEAARIKTALLGLQQAKDSLGRTCLRCLGQPASAQGACPHCGGGQGGGRSSPNSGSIPLPLASGGGSGSPGGDGGGRVPEGNAVGGFEPYHEKVEIGPGSIIGRILVDGGQIKGAADRELSEVVTAAQREASDRIQRDRIPRQYQGAVKAYFSNARRAFRLEPPARREGDSDSDAKAAPGAADARDPDANTPNEP